MPIYVALLRGINVGGKNPIRMPALKAAFETDGFEDVTTYIQSGNVVFRSAGAGSASTMARRIEEMLATSFPGYPASVVLRSHVQMRAVIEEAPRGFGTDPAGHRYDVAFLKAPLTARAALRQLSMNEGVDEAHGGRGVLYFSRLVSRLTSSRLNKVASLAIYQDMTLRNWNTTTKLLAMMDAVAA